METTAVFNNHILTDQERRQLTIIADETIQTFAESIDGMHQVIQEFPPCVFRRNVGQVVR